MAFGKALAALVMAGPSVMTPAMEANRVTFLGEPKAPTGLHVTPQGEPKAREALDSKKFDGAFTNQTGERFVFNIDYGAKPEVANTAAAQQQTFNTAAMQPT